ncbi:MAG: M16 family metallopeptidase [Thermoplasmata archaeon]
MPRSSVRRPRIRSLTLANGLRVLLAPDESSPTASVWVWYRVGSKNEVPGITGASHWVEHMLFEGSPRYAKGEIDRAVLRVGGALNAFTDTDFTAYFTTVPRDHLSVPLDIEADRMTRAAITDEEVARERTVIHSEREGNENWPEFRVEEELLQLAFRVHPYRWDALGRRRDIEEMTAGQLREYYRRFYGPKNAVLVVAGGFDVRRTEAEVRRRFSKLPAWGEGVEVGDVEPPQVGERRSTLSGPGTTPFIQVGWRSPGLADPTTPATLVLDTILGGESRVFSAGMGWRGRREHPTARLYRALVDTGLAVRATSGWTPHFYPSLFTVQTQAAQGVSLDQVETALEAVVERLARYGPSVKEMSDVRTRVRRGAALAYEGATSTGFRIGYFATLRSLSLEDELYRNLLRVSARAVREQARALFRKEARIVVRYVPTGAVSDE